MIETFEGLRVRRSYAPGATRNDLPEPGSKGSLRVLHSGRIENEKKRDDGKPLYSLPCSWYNGQEPSVSCGCSETVVEESKQLVVVWDKTQDVTIIELVGRVNLPDYLEYVNK